jgi:NRPS condensation-like uncharacterized protein
VAGDVGFRRAIGAERVALTLPFNVVMVGRVRGDLEPATVASALEALRRRHPLLAVRAEFDKQGNGWFTGDEVPAIMTHVEQRQSQDHWLAFVKEELRAAFPLETGPLVRCTVVHAPAISEIVLCGHHAILDGMSLGYLLRDVLRVATGRDEGLQERLDPPAIDRETVRDPRRIRPLARFVLSRINKNWTENNIVFAEEDRRLLYSTFWAKNQGMQILAWEMDAVATSALVARCRAEKVTVNAALWAALLAAQHDVQGPGMRHRRRSGMAVNTRDRLKVPVGEAFGFYASSLTVDLPYDPRHSFWANARSIRSRIARELARADIFRMLSTDAVHPTLWDSLYFAKYGLLDETAPRRLLALMGWDELTYGCSLTNLGRFEIPTTYGSLELEAVYGPVVYSDVNEKTVGAITVGGRLSYVMTFNEDVLGEGGGLRNATVQRLDDAVQLR